MESKRGEKRMGIRKRHVNEFPTPYTCTAAIREGGMETKLSMVLMGFGNIMHKQKIKGLIYLAVEVAYVVFMVLNGIRFLSMLGTLGTVEQKEVWDEVNQIYTYTKGDQSVLILLYGVATILVTILMIWAWRGALKKRVQGGMSRQGRKTCEQLCRGRESTPPRESAPSSDDTSDGVYLCADHPAFDLYDLYGIYKLQ